MKTVRLKVSVAGLDFSWVPGQEVEMEDVEAAKWADGVRGEFVRKPKTPEAAVKPAETPEREGAPETPEAKTEQPVRRGPGRPRKS